MRCGFISSCQSAAASEIVKRSRGHVFIVEQHYVKYLTFTFTFYLYLFTFTSAEGRRLCFTRVCVRLFVGLSAKLPKKL